MPRNTCTCPDKNPYLLSPMSPLCTQAKQGGPSWMWGYITLPLVVTFDCFQPYYPVCCVILNKQKEIGGCSTLKVKLFYLKTWQLPGARCLLYNAISGIILLCTSPIFVITHEEWEEISACQLFEERRKETTKGRAVSHKGFPICNMQLFLFRELEQPVPSQPKSGSQL